MTGGSVVRIEERGEHYLVQVQDRRPSDRQWRLLERNQKTRCIGIGDKIWWQSQKAYWTPQGMPVDGGHYDIPVGRCLPANEPVEEPA